MTKIPSTSSNFSAEIVPVLYGSNASGSLYLGMQASAHILLRNVSKSATEAVECFEVPEPEIIPYQYCHSSGVLSFWNDPAEDIYTSDDGEPL